jgi:hypothetical protein
MVGYSKLFSEIVTSSIWSEDDKTRIVWITMLALKDKDGFVAAAIPGLANAARVTVEECEKAITKLESPDKYSRSVDNEGRRVKRVDGGWMVLNHLKYRDKRNDEERREYQRQWQYNRRHQNVDTNVDNVDTMLTHTDTDTDTDKNKSKRTTTKRFIKPSPEEVTEYAKSIGFALNGSQFCDYYEANGWKVGRNAMKSWQAAVRTWKQRNKAEPQQQPSKPTVFSLIKRKELLEEQLGHARNESDYESIKRFKGDLAESNKRILEATK